MLTRPHAAAQHLVAEIERRGGRALPFPALEIAGLPLDAASAELLARAHAFNYWIFISRNAVEHGVRWLRQAHVDLAGVTAIAIGPTTQRALLDAGFARVCVSQAGFDSEAALALPELQAVSGAHSALIFRGRGGRETLRQELEARGFRVSYLECYERREPAGDPAALLTAWRAGKVQAVSAMSAETLNNFMAWIGAEGLTRMRASALFVPHERIAAQARASGVADVWVTGVGDDALLAALEARFGARHE